MSIIDAFDKDGIEIIKPSMVARKIEGLPETAIAVFSQTFCDMALKKHETVQISEMFAGRTVPIYEIVYKGKKLAFYHTLLGGAACAALLEEIFAKGVKRVIFFGSCGSLDKDITGGHLIIPTHAYRDEGTSYHYAAPEDYIEVKTSARLSELFDEMKLAYIRTKTWTTDSFYRETQENMRKRTEEGCAVVEMECASIMAAAQYRGREAYEFLYAADCLDEGSWDRRILGSMPCDMRERILKIAFETAARLD